MKHKKSLWLDIAEYISLTASAAGTILAIATHQVAYAATPLTLALFLNAVNRCRFQRQVQVQNRRTIVQVRRAIRSVHRQAKKPLDGPINLNLIAQSIEQLERRMQMLTQQFDSRLQETTQLESRLNALTLRIDNLPQAWEAVDTSAIEAEIVSLQAQLKTVDPSSLNNSIAHLQNHIDSLNHQLENLPAPFDPSEIEQQLTELKDSHSTYGEDLRCLVSSIVNLRLETVVAEQARMSQLDALMLQLKSLSTTQESSDVSSVEDAGCVYSQFAANP